MIDAAHAETAAVVERLVLGAVAHVCGEPHHGWTDGVAVGGRQGAVLFQVVTTTEELVLEQVAGGLADRGVVLIQSLR